MTWGKQNRISRYTFYDIYYLAIDCLPSQLDPKLGMSLLRTIESLISYYACNYYFSMPKPPKI